MLKGFQYFITFSYFTSLIWFEDLESPLNNGKMINEPAPEEQYNPTALKPAIGHPTWPGPIPVRPKSFTLARRARLRS
jgi:hypothetical protein